MNKKIVALVCGLGLVCTVTTGVYLNQDTAVAYKWLTDDTIHNYELEPNPVADQLQYYVDNNMAYLGQFALENIIEEYQPNEAGKIMIIMWHNFVPEYEPGMNKNITTTIDNFREFVQMTYDDGYRLISMEDYINHYIDVPAGCIPMIFTFDDGTGGQFSLIEDESGNLIVNPDTAVGVLEEFKEKYDDFSAKGIFYVNMGESVFKGAGSLQQRLEVLTGLGYEVGNHTYNHVVLPKLTTKEEIIYQAGKSQQALEELLPGYKLLSLALPYGEANKELQPYLVSGEYEGVAYDHKTIMLVGAEPALTTISEGYDATRVRRIIASGMERVDYDILWWLENIKRDKLYVSDGNPNRIVVPESKRELVNEGAAGEKTLVYYPDTAEQKE